VYAEQDVFSKEKVAMAAPAADCPVDGYVFAVQEPVSKAMMTVVGSMDDCGQGAAVVMVKPKENLGGVVVAAATLTVNVVAEAMREVMGWHRTVLSLCVLKKWRVLREDGSTMRIVMRRNLTGKRRRPGSGQGLTVLRGIRGRKMRPGAESGHTEVCEDDEMESCTCCQG
jgi:hypothetical protein